MPRHNQGRAVWEKRASSWRGKGVRLEGCCGQAKNVLWGQIAPVPASALLSSPRPDSPTFHFPTGHCSGLRSLQIWLNSPNLLEISFLCVLHSLFQSNVWSCRPFARSGALVQPETQLPCGTGTWWRLTATSSIQYQLLLPGFSHAARHQYVPQLPPPSLNLTPLDTVPCLCLPYLLEYPPLSGPFPSRIFPSLYRLGWNPALAFLCHWSFS